MDKKDIIQSEAGKTNNKMWMWIVIAVIVLLVLFFIFKGAKKGEKIILPGQATADINSLDVGDNPDIAVDDFGSIDVSQEDIFP